MVVCWNATQAREAATICVTETQKHDRESKIDPDADEVGKTELDSDEISDDESKKRPSQRKPKYVKVGGVVLRRRCQRTFGH